MKETIVILLFMSFIFISCSTIDRKENLRNALIEEPYQNRFRIGPILLKVNKEWLIEKDCQYFIRIGMSKKTCFETANSEYELISPKALSVNTIEKKIKNR